MDVCGNPRAGSAYFKRRKSGSVGQYRGCCGPRSIPARKIVFLGEQLLEIYDRSNYGAASLQIVKHLSDVRRSWRDPSRALNSSLSCSLSSRNDHSHNLVTSPIGLQYSIHANWRISSTKHIFLSSFPTKHGKSIIRIYICTSFIIYFSYVIKIVFFPLSISGFRLYIFLSASGCITWRLKNDTFSFSEANYYILNLEITNTT